MRRKHLWAVVVLLAAYWGAPHAQDRRVNRFEVATIKPHDPDSRRGFSVEVYPGGRVLLSAMTLRSLVSAAFRHSSAQIAIKGDAWIENARYTIEAKAPENAGITNFNHTLFDIEDERLREMLQTLLIDRFELRVRRETRTGDVYQLTRTGKPFGLQPAKIPEGRDPSSLSSSIGYASGRWVMRFTTMPQLAKFASTTMVRAPVVDLTTLSDPFDYRQQVPDAEPAYAGIEHTNSFVRMLSDVGLELKRSTGPVEWLVIENAVRPTAD
jgi:uncharacterized protein (TIGR03435 family)